MREREAGMLNDIGNDLRQKIEQDARKRTTVEERWIDDLRHYHGQYAGEELTKLFDPKYTGSKLFANFTRHKTIQGNARLADMLFPTDDRNWALKQTPVPEVESDEPVISPMRKPVMKEDGSPLTVGELAKEAMDEAVEAAKLMQDEIDDQLVEARYNAVAREVIEHAGKVGTGIVAGPIIAGKRRKRWVVQDGVASLVSDEDPRPVVAVVEPWNFYPDGDARSLEDCERVTERRFLTKRAMFELLEDPDVLHEQLMAAIVAKPQPLLDTNFSANLREITGLESIPNSARYELLICYGPLTAKQLCICGADLEGAEEIAEEIEIPSVVWMVGNRVIKAYPNPMETGDFPFSVFNWEKDDASPFGFGVPYLLRNPQKAGNAAWRMMLDNGGLAAKPQVVVDDEAIEPVDGKWEITPGKIWRKKRPDVDASRAFTIHQVVSNQGDIANIYQMSREMVDEETNLPMVAQGEQGSASQTATGMSLLMNSANIILRRAVKNWDDDVTSTLINRFFDWNMQNNEKPEIKGDFEIEPRGSSHLLVKETQARNASTLLQLSFAEPIAAMTDYKKAWRQTIKAMQHEPDEWIVEEEAEEEGAPDPMAAQAQMAEKMAAQQAQAQQQEAQAKAQMDQLKLQLERSKLELNYAIHREKMEDAEAERQLRRDMSLMERDTQMMKLSADQNIALDKIKAELSKVAMKEQGANARFTTEKELKLATGSGI